MKNLVRTFILATLATCITSYTACEQTTASAPVNSTIVNTQSTLQLESSSTGSSHDNPTMNSTPAISTYLIAGGTAVVAIFGIIMAIRHHMHRDLETPYIAVEDPQAHLALSQII